MAVESAIALIAIVHSDRVTLLRNTGGRHSRDSGSLVRAVIEYSCGNQRQVMAATAMTSPGSVHFNTIPA